MEVHKEFHIRVFTAKSLKTSIDISFIFYLQIYTAWLSLNIRYPFIFINFFKFSKKTKEHCYQHNKG